VVGCNASRKTKRLKILAKIAGELSIFINIIIRNSKEKRAASTKLTALLFF
jgi:hypothetical protein